MGHLDGTCPGQCPGHVQDIEIFLGHCPVPALRSGIAAFIFRLIVMTIESIYCITLFNAFSFSFISSQLIISTFLFSLFRERVHSPDVATRNDTNNLQGPTVVSAHH